MSGTTAPPTPPSESLTSPQFVANMVAMGIAGLTVAGLFLRTDVPVAVLTGIAGTVVGAGMVTVVNFYSGSSSGSQKKDERDAATTPTQGTPAP